MSTKNKIMLAVLILLGVGAAVGLIYGITTNDERDAGIMEVCWSENQANYNTEACVYPTPLLWPLSRLPLFIVPVDSEISGAPENTQRQRANAAELLAAINSVNDQVGCEVFRLEENLPSGKIPDVTVDMEATILVGQDRAGGAVSHFKEPHLRAHVSIMAVGDPYLRTRALIHELGHVLGLAHDDFESSIMYPIQIREQNMRFLAFTSHDRSLLNETYCFQ